jgi:hypothetical protein
MHIWEILVLELGRIGGVIPLLYHCKSGFVTFLILKLVENRNLCRD